MRSFTALKWKYICPGVMNFIIKSEKGCLSICRHLIQVFSPNHDRKTGDLVFGLKVMLVDPKMDEGHLVSLRKPD